MDIEKCKQVLSFDDEDIELNRLGKISARQKKMLKEETSSAVRDLFYIAIIFPSALILLSTVILLVWLFINSPEMIREIAIGCLGVAFVFYAVRKVLLKDLWDSSTVLTYDLKDMEPIENLDRSETLYSNESVIPFHIPGSLENDFKSIPTLRIYYNPTHKRILSLEEIKTS
ncbi:MAG: hypothetical protein JJT78_03725 [Leptospira sp.]|nr:hypothetical protein [Leptospira sp.]